MNANQIVAKLTWEEVDGNNEPDMRRVLRDERMALQGAVQSGDPERVADATREARKVASMWGVQL